VAHLKLQTFAWPTHNSLPILTSHLAILSHKAQANEVSLNNPYIFQQTANTKFHRSCSGRHDTLGQGSWNYYDTARAWRGSVHRKEAVLLEKPVTFKFI